jgi:hypothetical protein
LKAGPDPACEEKAARILALCEQPAGTGRTTTASPARYVLAADAVHAA